jgi:uncharacterized protein YjbI with pentapeptide repeats
LRLILVLFFIALIMLIGIAAGELRVVQASEINDKVEKGEPIDYSNVKIDGDLNLSGLKSHIAGHIAFPIRIADSVISNSIELNNVILDEPVNFKRTRFMGPASFIGNQFKGSTSFDNSLFDTYAYFYGSTFKGPSQFINTKFNKSADFTEANFENKADFYGSWFNGTAKFLSVTFKNDAYFDAAIFFKSASFREAHFSRARFVGADFKDDVDFQLAQINETADFIGTRLNKKLYLTGIKFSKLSIVWADIKNGLFCDGPTYMLLIKNFKDMEQFEDADNCYYQYRDEKRQDGPFGWGKFFDYLSWLSCGYGVRWHHPILSGFMIAILFGLYYESYNLKSIVAIFHHKKEIDNNFNWDLIHDFKKSLSFSVMLLLSLPPEWSRFGREEYVEFVRRHWFSGIMERLIGWGLVLLLIGTLTRLMVRY